MQVYEILRKKQIILLVIEEKKGLFDKKTRFYSSSCTKTTLFFTFDKNEKNQILKKMLTIPYIYDRITRLDV